LDQYCRLLWQWNRKLNLTRHTDLEKFVARDVVDSLQLAELLAADEEVLDVGTGGGVPGVVLAVVRPDVRISLCESVGKKAYAVDDIVRRLHLQVPVHRQRVEMVLEDFHYTTLVARAVGPMRKILQWLGPHWSSVGRLLLIKGPRWVEERREARQLGLLQDLELRCVVTYPMAGTFSESVVLKIWPKQPKGPQHGHHI
jgi:16S rRNA (guanine527-N7)-methyltransferase